MIALFSALLGFFSSALPEFLSLFREEKDKKHEIALLKLQMAHAENLQRQKESAEMRAETYRLEALDQRYFAREVEVLNQRPDGTGERKTGILLVDALSGSVRPVVTYLFFSLYAAVKYAQFHLLIRPAQPFTAPLSAQEALVSLWTADDMAVFSAIIAFWFGSRLFKKPGTAAGGVR